MAAAVEASGRRDPMLAIAGSPLALQACPESAIMTSMDDTTQARWFHPTPGRFVLALLAVEVLLWLSERFGWWHKGYAVLTGVALVGMAMVLILGWQVVALVFRWRLQFSVRTLLVLTVAVAVPCSWLAVKRQQVKREREAAAAFETLGGDVLWSLSGPRWMRSVVGYDLFSQLCYVHLKGTQITDGELENIKGLSQLRELDLYRTGITDRGLENLKGLSQLRYLTIGDANVTDKGLETLKELSQLWKLEIYGTNVTDEGVKKLQQALPNCKIER